MSAPLVRLRALTTSAGGPSACEPPLGAGLSRIIQLRVAEQVAARGDMGGGPQPPPWPRGLLGGSGGAPTALPPGLAAELLYEVGWHSRHVLLDVRPAVAFASARPRGALSVPLLPVDTLVERAAAAVGFEADARMVVAGGGGDADADAERAARALLGAGYANTVVLQGGFARHAPPRARPTRPPPRPALQRFAPPTALPPTELCYRRLCQVDCGRPSVRRRRRRRRGRHVLSSPPRVDGPGSADAANAERHGFGDSQMEGCPCTALVGGSPRGLHAGQQASPAAATRSHARSQRDATGRPARLDAARFGTRRA